MSLGLNVSLPPSDDAKYARFARRLRAWFIDWLLLLLTVICAMLIAVTLESNDFSRVLGILVVLIILLYEPILVSMTGSTIGHFLTNLRVVDNLSHRNLSFPKAFARLFIKDVFGPYSFFTMAMTRRHQALHDVLTKSTVQIRDPARASPHHYHSERLELASRSMPSRT